MALFNDQGNLADIPTDEYLAVDSDFFNLLKRILTINVRIKKKPTNNSHNLLQLFQEQLFHVAQICARSRDIYQNPGWLGLPSDSDESDADTSREGPQDNSDASRDDDSNASHAGDDNAGAQWEDLIAVPF